MTMDNLTYPLITIITMKQNTILSYRAHRDNIVLFYNFYYGSRSFSRIIRRRKLADRSADGVIFYYKQIGIGYERHNSLSTA